MKNREKLVTAIRSQIEVAAEVESDFITLTVAEGKAILNLLKEPPVEVEIEGGGNTWWHVCGDCRGSVDTQDRFCKHCGKPLKQ